MYFKSKGKCSLWKTYSIIFSLELLLLLAVSCIAISPNVIHNVLRYLSEINAKIIIGNIFVVIIFQFLFYKNRMRKLYSAKENAEENFNSNGATLKNNYLSFFGTKSYLAKYLELGDTVNKDITSDIINEKTYRKKILEKRIFRNRFLFSQGCLWLSASFMLTYAVLLLLSSYKFSKDKESDKELQGTIPLNTTLIEYEYKSKYFNDTLIFQFHPSLFNYIVDGVVYNLEDYAISESSDSISLYRKEIKFKHSFLKSDSTFIKEIATGGLEFDKIRIKACDTSSTPIESSKKFINLYDKYTNRLAKLENCIQTLLTNISSLIVLILFALLSHDTHSFRSKFTRQWNVTMAIFFFVFLSLVEICLAIILDNNSYIVGNFICKSISATVSVIVVAALVGRLMFLQENANNRKVGFWKQFLLFIGFGCIYIYAVSQIFYPFGPPIIKTIDKFSLFTSLLVCSCFGKIALFCLLYIFTKDKIIEKFFVFEINAIKSPEKHAGIEEFYYLMRYENKEEKNELDNAIEIIRKKINV